MVLTSTDNSVSIFKDGKLKPGIYKIQNIVGQTYLEVRNHSKQLCCRSATALKDGNELVHVCFIYHGNESSPVGDLSSSGPGYTIHRVQYKLCFHFIVVG